MIMINDILTVNHLTMRFSGLIALNNVNLEVKRGSITALIGPNGAGKTTLFNCLTGFYTAQSGDLLFFVKDKIINLRHFIGGSHLVARAGIARTFQNSRLFREMTVVENCLVAQTGNNRNLISGFLNTKHFRKLENEALTVAFEWLDKFDLTKDANRLAGLLPYGKQRHLEIARAMCTKPSLLCLDEPAAGLNPHETHELRDIILSLRKEHDVSILLIEHDMSLVMNISDHIVVLDHGTVICSGSPLNVRHDKRVIEAYLGIENAK